MFYVLQGRPRVLRRKVGPENVHIIPHVFLCHNDTGKHPHEYF